MKEEYVSYEQSQALKRLGFAEPCDTFYNSHLQLCRYSDSDVINRNTNGHHTPSCSAPRLDQAQKWLREVKGVEIVVEPRFCNYKRIGYDWHVYDDCSNDYALRAPLPFSETYELALSDGISGALELLTNNTK